MCRERKLGGGGGGEGEKGGGGGRGGFNAINPVLAPTVTTSTFQASKLQSVDGSSDISGTARRQPLDVGLFRRQEVVIASALKTEKCNI